VFRPQRQAAIAAFSRVYQRSPTRKGRAIDNVASASAKLSIRLLLDPSISGQQAPQIGRGHVMARKSNQTWRTSSLPVPRDHFSWIAVYCCGSRRVTPVVGSRMPTFASASSTRFVIGSRHRLSSSRARSAPRAIVVPSGRFIGEPSRRGAGGQCEAVTRNWSPRAAHPVRFQPRASEKLGNLSPSCLFRSTTRGASSDRCV